MLKIILIILGAIVGLVILCAVGFFLYLRFSTNRKKSAPASDVYVPEFMRNPGQRPISSKRYNGEEHDWHHTFNLQHRGVRVRNIPFVPDKKEVFYLENEFDEEANRFIRENIGYIRERFAEKGLRFTYLPDMKLDIDKIRMSAKYLDPKFTGKEISIANGEWNGVVIRDGIASVRSNFLLDYMVRPENRNNVHSSFAWFGSEKVNPNTQETIYTFDYITFDGKEALEHPKEIIDEILPEVGESKIFGSGGLFMIVHDAEPVNREQNFELGSKEERALGNTDDGYNGSINSDELSPSPPRLPMYSPTSRHSFNLSKGRKLKHSDVLYDIPAASSTHTNINVADYQFEDLEALDMETKEILLTVQHEIDRLRLKGIGETIIARFVHPKVEISHMIITHDFRIILDEFNDMEIGMEPIVKTVYIFFLRHPEGVMFKDLPDYRKEMEIIYRCVKDKKNDIDHQMSLPTTPTISPAIETLTDPTKNSINEKCSRIRAAFVSKFDDTIARYYYVMGRKSSKKKVVFPREEVTWE